MAASNEGGQYTSSWGEVSPSEITVDLYTKNDGQIVEIRAQNSKIDYSKMAFINRPPVAVTTFGAPYKYPPLARVQAQKTRIEAGLHTSLARSPHYFTLLDVGRWGGPAPSSAKAQRDFGIVWMRYVALCEFVPQDAQLDTDQHLLLDNAGVPLSIPVNQVIRVQVTGADVIHAFALPAFGLKTDGIPGRVNETWFKAEKVGTYYGQCSELCGIDHAFMPIEIKVVTQPEFEAWVVAKGGSMAVAAAAPVAAATIPVALAPASINPAAPAPAAAAPTTTPAPAAAPAAK